MPVRQVGESGLSVSRMGLGTMMWGGDTDLDDVTAQLEMFCDAGGNLVDTASGYGGGQAPVVLGEAIASLKCRDDLVVCAKSGASVSNSVRIVDTSRRALMTDLESLLTDLEVDTVDVWLIQGFNNNIDVYETVSTAQAAVDQGKARYVGVSNVNGWQLARMGTAAQNRPGVPIVAVQTEFHALNVSAQEQLIPAADHLGVGIFAYSALARGVLTGKYRSSHIPADSRAASEHLSDYVGRYLDESFDGRINAVLTAAEGLSCEPAHVALAWVRDHPSVSSAIVGARTAAQLAMLLDAEDVTLPEPIRHALDDVCSGHLSDLVSDDEE